VPDSAQALRKLAADVEREARRAPFDVCRETYAAANRDPAVPILCGGTPTARFCCFGRELGRDEVFAAEPLVGMGGRRLRRALHDALLASTAGPAPKSERRFAGVLERVFLANTVPYRPVDNEAYDDPTLARFRPFTERLLTEVWSGEIVFPLGDRATRWWAPYAAPGEIEALWKDTARRFRDTVRVRLGGRTLTIAPVPHPSPLSPFRAEFPALIAERVRRLS
jgi:uracil-DNA glycosylase